MLPERHAQALRTVVSTHPVELLPSTSIDAAVDRALHARPHPVRTDQICGLLATANGLAGIRSIAPVSALYITFTSPSHPLDDAGWKPFSKLVAADLDAFEGPRDRDRFVCVGAYCASEPMPNGEHYWFRDHNGAPELTAVAVYTGS